MCKWMKKKRGGKATNVDETHVQVHKGIFIHFGASVFSPHFSPNFGEKFLVGPERNTWALPHFFFHSPSSQPNTH